MVRSALIHGGDHHLEVSLPLAIGIFVTVSVVAALCARHERRVSSKCVEAETGDPKLAARSPLPSTRKLISIISNRAIPFVSQKKSGGGVKSEAEIESNGDGGGFGEGGLWQRAILMGEKCQPPEFSGVIYYDCRGNRISELPRSPRASPLHSFSLPAVAENEN